MLLICLSLYNNIQGLILINVLVFGMLLIPILPLYMNLRMLFHVILKFLSIPSSDRSTVLDALDCVSVLPERF